MLGIANRDDGVHLETEFNLNLICRLHLGNCH